MAGKFRAVLPADNPRKTFAKKVRAARTLKGISQEKLAELADLHRTYVSLIEAGKANISVDIMGRLAKALGCKVKDLL